MMNDICFKSASKKGFTKMSVKYNDYLQDNLINSTTKIMIF